MPAPLVAIFSLIAAIWLLLIAYAQLTCSLIPSIGTQCHDERGDVWMLPLFTAPVGGFALLGLILMAVVAMCRR
jgi:hypothetical protein